MELRDQDDPSQSLDQNHHYYRQFKQQQESQNPKRDSAASGSNFRPPPPLQPPAPSTAALPSDQYRECLKNHAANIGGHVLDGCGEFMPNGEEGTPEALKCAACECHRSFHWKENTAPVEQTPSPPLRPHRSLTHSMMMGFSTGRSGPPVESSNEDLNMFHFTIGAKSMEHNPQSSSRKRFRTKFSEEQKEKMTEFAEKLDWKLQKQDEQGVQKFCEEVGVKRKVFKVWLHNNKQAMKKKQI